VKLFKQTYFWYWFHEIDLKKFFAKLFYSS
jgi:hypothetical protein